MNINAIESESRGRKSLAELSPEILLSIFSNFDSNEVVVFRRVCKQFLDVINTNKLLWRIFEWVQQKEDEVYPSQAIDLFDEKSGSTLEEISIQEEATSLIESKLTHDDLKHLLEVLGKSRASIKRVSIKAFDWSRLLDQTIQLSNSLPRLRELVLRRSSLNVRFKNGSKGSKSDSRSQLKILALPYPRKIQSLTLPIDSLVSFSCEGIASITYLLSLFTQFSEPVLHLDFKTHNFMEVDPISCPRLRVLQALLQDTVTSYFNCPSLQVLILRSVVKKETEELPPSLEEIWLVERADFSSNDWDFLQNSCPKLKTLKLGEGFIKLDDDDDESEELNLFAFIDALQRRQGMVESGKEIDGIKMNPLQKVVIPTEFFVKSQLDRLEKVVVEVIDLKEYPDSIEVKY